MTRQTLILLWLFFWLEGQNRHPSTTFDEQHSRNGRSFATQEGTMNHSLDSDGKDRNAQAIKHEWQSE